MRAKSGKHKDARADDGAHSQRRELASAERALEAVLAGFACFREQHVHRLFYEKPASGIAGSGRIEFV